MRLDLAAGSFDVDVSGPADGPPVLLLHGFPQNRHEWHLVTPRLHEAGLRTVALDQRGYSPGARPDGAAAYTPRELVGDVVDLLDALSLESAHVVGHDWGAVVGWYVAGWHPDRVRTLTAFSVPHPLAHGLAIRRDPDQQARSQYMRLLQTEGEAERTLLADDGAYLRRFFTGSGLSDEQLEPYLGPLRDPAALTATLNWYRAIPLSDPRALGSITVPTTYVWSTGDLAVARAAAEGCAAFVEGDYRFLELAGVSHWIPDQDAGSVSDAILGRVLG